MASILYIGTSFNVIFIILGNLEISWKLRDNVVIFIFHMSSQFEV